MFNATTSLRQVKFLGVRYHNLMLGEAMITALGMLDRGERSDIFFLNADGVRLAQNDKEYRTALNDAELVLSDGIGLRLLTKLNGGRMRDNCNGTDFSPQLIAQAALRGYSLYLLGGKPGVAEKAADNLSQIIRGLKIAGTSDGYFQDDKKMVEHINASGADILFVAMGAPKQEKWIASHRRDLKPRMCLGVGALLDYFSGAIHRAPQWMVHSNLEWFWRIFIDPKRMFKRYIIDDMGFLLGVLFFLNHSK
ncbi:MAG: WecB/TagA/CpsF family glycosyltransferase [Candidatus Omnitrophica bacterium]|nr:WecB/TagA/CpsF family glycosyltransferase [Candidatus Omnitrophota bacterium]